MDRARVLPKFATESEEAEWWLAHREEHAEQFVAAAAAGEMTRNGLATRLAAARAALTLDLQREDIVKAKELARARGIEMSALLTQIVHEALERESQTAA